MSKIPISLNIDDFTPIVHVFYEHSPENNRKTKDGRPLLPTIPNSFMERFCSIVEKYDVRGKLSVVPLPGGKNPYDTDDAKLWMKLLDKHLKGRFSFCPEMITHHKTYDIDRGSFLDLNEEEWSNNQTEENLTRYITYALELLKERGITPTGVTSPWQFGSKVIGEYRNAILTAYNNVFGKSDVWYFLDKKLDARPEVVINNGETRLVSISATTDDYFWQSINNPSTDKAFIYSMADFYITEGGKDGAIIDSLNAGGHPVMLTHWQSLFSNGLGTGLSALEVVLERIDKNLSDRVEFMSYDEKIKDMLE